MSEKVNALINEGDVQYIIGVMIQKKITKATKVFTCAHHYDRS